MLLGSSLRVQGRPKAGKGVARAIGRWLRKGWQVREVLPPPEVKDVNDLARAGC